MAKKPRLQLIHPGPTDLELAKHLDEEAHTALSEYAWKYFSGHAEQRLTTFRFYILFLTAASTACGWLIKNGIATGWGILTGFALCYFSWVFAKIDRRNRTLVSNSERALRALEYNQYPSLGKPRIVDLFRYERYFSRVEKFDQKRWGRLVFWGSRLHYYDCFRRIFWGFGAFGLIFATYNFVYGHGPITRWLQDIVVALISHI